MKCRMDISKGPEAGNRRYVVGTAVVCRGGEKVGRVVVLMPS